MVKSEVLTVMSMKKVVFYDVAPCGLVDDDGGSELL
jgi:hypothetical protein